MEKTNYEKEQFVKNIFKCIQLYHNKFNAVLNSLPIKNKEEYTGISSPNNININIILDLLKKKADWGVNECKYKLMNYFKFSLL